MADAAAPTAVVISSTGIPHRFMPSDVHKHCFQGSSIHIKQNQTSFYLTSSPKQRFGGGKSNSNIMATWSLHNHKSNAKQNHDSMLTWKALRADNMEKLYRSCSRQSTHIYWCSWELNNKWYCKKKWVYMLWTLFEFLIYKYDCCMHVVEAVIKTPRK